MVPSTTWAPFYHTENKRALVNTSFHMRIVKIQRVGQSARILPIHVKEGVKRGKSTSFFHFRKRQELGHEKSGK